MRILQIVIFSIAISSSAFAQNKVGDLIPLAEVPESIALTQYADNYAKAVASNDYALVAELTHDDVIKMGGGAEFIISDLKADGDQLTNQGFKYTNTEVGNHPEFLKSESQLQTVVPIRYYLTYQGKEVEAWSNLFACSTDEGVTWKFVNLEKFDEASLREFVSNVSPEFVFPSR